MNSLKIGLLREGKTPPDKRVAFTPAQAQEIQQRFPHVQIICQESPFRCFTDDEYRARGVAVRGNVTDCDVLMGIKEVPIANIISGKRYLFFSHTIKKQPYNRNLLLEGLKRKIQLIDYEALKDHQGNRLVAFGRYAGIVGAYNGLWTYGRRYGAYAIRRAYECFDVNDLKLELRKITLPPIKIVLTGAGRVAKGAMETLDTAGIRKVGSADFLNLPFDEPVYVQLSSADYHVPNTGGHFNREEFHQFPERYHSTFFEFTKVADVLMAGAYWNPKAPALFSRQDMSAPGFRLKIISDITCDIGGSVPSTKKASTILDPVYDYDPVSDSIFPGFSNPALVNVMSVDNLPCELPRSASEEFGRDLIDRILQPLLGTDPENVIARATVADGGTLTSSFNYLEDFVKGDN